MKPFWQEVWDQIRHAGAAFCVCLAAWLSGAHLTPIAGAAIGGGLWLMRDFTLWQNVVCIARRNDRPPPGLFSTSYSGLRSTVALINCAFWLGGGIVGGTVFR